MWDHVLDEKVNLDGMKNYVDLGNDLDQVKEEVSCLSARLARPEWGGADAREIWAGRACSEQDRDGPGRVRLGNNDVDDVVHVKGLDVADVVGTKMLVQDVDTLGVRLPAQRQNG